MKSFIWCFSESAHFATGRVDGYFENEVPEAFFKLLALYIGCNQLSSIPWAIKFGQKEVNVMMRQAEMVMRHYENYTIDVPKWYLSELKYG